MNDEIATALDAIDGRIGIAILDAAVSKNGRRFGLIRCGALADGDAVFAVTCYPPAKRARAALDLSAAVLARKAGRARKEQP